MKFGGTSVGAPDRMRRVVRFVAQAASERRAVVIVSALSKVTRLLQAGVHGVADGTATAADVLEELRSRHLEQARTVLREATLPGYEATLSQRLSQLQALLTRAQTGGAAPPLVDAVLATGEQLSVPMLALALEDAGVPAAPSDSTRLLCTDDTHGAANVNVERTARQIRAWHETLPEEAVPVAAGFIGATPEGATTTLGFEGSDYSAALFAAILEAHTLERWTDVDGLYTDDPRTNDEAERIDEIVLEEASALNEKGQLGMHPKALRPLVGRSVVVHIRSTQAPEQPGTRLIPRSRLAAAPSVLATQPSRQESG